MSYCKSLLLLINRKIMKSHDKYLAYFLTHSGMRTLLKQTFTGSPHDVRRSLTGSLLYTTTLWLKFQKFCSKSIEYIYIHTNEKLTFTHKNYFWLYK